jgi:hypothetical protein
MHRPTVGAIASVLLGSTAVLWLWPPDWQIYAMLLAACTRLGLLMGVIWLAHPQLARLPAGLFEGLLVVVLVVAVRPKLLLFAAPLLVALLAVWAMRPRS